MPMTSAPRPLITTSRPITVATTTSAARMIWGSLMSARLCWRTSLTKSHR